MPASCRHVPAATCGAHVRVGHAGGPRIWLGWTSCQPLGSRARQVSRPAARKCTRACSKPGRSSVFLPLWSASPAPSGQTLPSGLLTPTPQPEGCRKFRQGRHRVCPQVCSLPLHNQKGASSTVRFDIGCASYHVTVMMMGLGGVQGRLP